jgi:hypothetical protein
MVLALALPPLARRHTDTWLSSVQAGISATLTTSNALRTPVAPAGSLKASLVSLTGTGATTDPIAKCLSSFQVAFSNVLSGGTTTGCQVRAQQAQQAVRTLLPADALDAECWKLSLTHIDTVHPGLESTGACFLWFCVPFKRLKFAFPLPWLLLPPCCRQL